MPEWIELTCPNDLLHKPHRLLNGLKLKIMVAQVNKNYRKYGLSRYIRRIVSYAFFEGRPHTTKGQWFNPFVLLNLRTLALIPGKPKLVKPVFITGLGRSGTTVLGVILSLHKELGFLNEPKAIWSLIDKRHDTNADYSSEPAQFILTEKDVSEHALLVSKRLFSRYLKMIGATRLLDKYPELIFRVDYVKALFPDACFIFISRNGADACHSIDLWSKRLSVKVGDRIDDWWGRGDVKWLYLKEQILFASPVYADIKDEIIENESNHVVRSALEWIVTMRQGIDQLKQHPDLIHVSYENLCHNPEQELTSIMKKLDLDISDDVITYAKENLYINKPKPLPELPPGINQLFNQTTQLLEEIDRNTA